MGPVMGPVMLLLLSCGFTELSVDGEGDSVGDTNAVVDSPDPGPQPLELCVNEFMPGNLSTLALEDGSHPDWIELHNPGVQSVVLAGWSLSDDPDDPRKHVLDGVPPVPAGGFTLLYADGELALGGEHLDFGLSRDGGALGLYAPDGRGAVLTYDEVTRDFAVARVSDCCQGASCFEYPYVGTPGRSNVPEVLEPVTLRPEGGEWRYWYGVEPPAAGWQAAGFDDAAWASGPAPLGYGDAHQLTVLDFGADPANKPLTAWFRASVVVEQPEDLRSLTLRLMRDDGAAVTLNGVEVARSNLPEGELVPTTLALAAAAEAEETAWWDFELDPALLLEGDNQLAVEVHQAAPTSSDMTFDVMLVGERVAP